MTLPSDVPVAVLRRNAAYLGDAAIGSPVKLDLTHLADLVVYAECVAVVFNRWVFPRSEDGLVLVQAIGPLRVRVGRFPPWQNTVAWVRDGPRLAILHLSPRKRRRLEAALRETGFGIKQDRASPIHGLRRHEP